MKKESYVPPLIKVEDLVLEDSIASSGMGVGLFEDIWDSDIS